MADARISLDTNILVYAADPSAGDRHRTARALVDRAGAGRGVLTQQVIGEFLNVGRRMTHLDQRRIRQIAIGLGEVFPVLATRRQTLYEAFDLAGHYTLQFWDAVIVAVCAADEITTLLTEDMNDGQRIAGVLILNPFRADNDRAIAAVL